MNKHTLLLVGLMTCLASVFSFAEEFGKLGDDAPPLTVKEWMKGKPVNLKTGTNVYVLVFCTLSRANDFAVTNLNNLQKQYQDKGVVVVVISDDPPEQLKELVQLKGAKMDFTIAADDIRRTTSSYQRVFRQMMLPRAFVVGQGGKVLWHGHPLRDNMGFVVDEITAGRFNLEQTQKKIQAAEQMEQYLALARQDDPRTAKAGRIMLTLRTNDATALLDLAFKIASDSFIEKRDVALATAALDRAAQLTTNSTTDIEVTRAILLFQTGREAEGLAKARQTLASAQTKEDKEQAQANLRAMETRLASEKASQTNAPAGKP